MKLEQKLTQLIEQLIIEGNLEEALRLLRDKYGKLSPDLNSTIILNLGRFNDLQMDIQNNEISDSNADVELARIRRNTLKLIQSNIPGMIQTKKMLMDYKDDVYELNIEKSFEKIIGDQNNLLKINWLEKGIRAAKSVCQVITEKDKGTGFIMEGGYLLTNNHVIFNEKIAHNTRIIFNYEEDIAGFLRKTVEYRLDASSYITAPAYKKEDGKLVSGLDYAYIKIKDDPENPIAEWGFLNLHTSPESVPKIDDDVIIIQHAKGETKQIASDNLIGMYNDKFYYVADTEKGSSGSPVFNKNWEVIALHHAGKGKSGYIINEEGEQKEANEGVPINLIINDIKEKQEKQKKQ